MEKETYHWIWSYDKESLSKGNWVYWYLEISENNNILTIIGNLKQNFPLSIWKITTVKIQYETPIYGIVDSHTKITLYKSYSFSQSLAMGWINKEKYKSQYVFWDWWIDSFACLRSGKIIASIPDLAKRFNKGIEIITQNKMPHIQISKNETNISLGTIEKIDILFKDRLAYSLGGEHYSDTINWKYYKKPSLQIKEITELIFTIEKSYTIENMLEFIEKTLRFFSFFMNQKVFYEELKIVFNNADKFDKPIILKLKNEVSTKDNEYLFLYDSISSEIQYLLTTWIENYYIITHVIDTYFFVYYTKGILIETTFLYYIQSLEGIYYTLFEPPYTESEYEDLKRQSKIIKKELSDSYPVIKKMNLFFNDVNLFEKLTNIWDHIGYNWNNENWGDTKQAIVDFRNILSHGVWWKKRQDIETNKNYLYYLINQMEFVIEICILKMLKISPDLLNSIFIKKEAKLKYLWVILD